MEKNKTRECKCSLEMVMLYFVFLVVNSLIVWLANIFFPTQVVLGTEHITKCWAITHSMGTLSLINVFTIPLVWKYERMKEKILSPKEWMVVCLVVNMVGLWVIARLADQLGLGVRSWLVVVVLGLIVSVIQLDVGPASTIPGKEQPFLAGWRL